MSWAIRIPYRPGDRPLDVAANAHHLKSLEDRQVVRELALAAEMTGFHSADEMVIGLGELTVEQRRRLLDLMRVRAGLKSSRQIDDEQSRARRVLPVHWDKADNLI